MNLINNNNKDNKEDIDIKIKKKESSNFKNKEKKLVSYIKVKKRRIIEIFLDKEIINIKAKEKEREVSEIVKLLTANYLIYRTNYYTLYNSSINNYR